VFERRARARRAAFAHGVGKFQSWRQQRERAAKPVRRVEPATVRFAPVSTRRDREYPTVPAMSR
jgi:hypothetical protein